MIVFLAVVISVFSIYLYFITQKIFSPPMIACLSLGGGAIIAACNMNYWGYDIHPMTVALILLGLGVFVFSYMIGNKIKWNECSAQNTEEKRFVVKKIYVLFFLFVATAAICGFYMEVNTHLLLLNISMDDDYALQHLHEAGRSTFDYSWYIKYPLAAVKIITIICLYCFIYNITRFKFELRDMYFLVPIPFYVMDSILRTDRNQVLLLILIAVSLYFLLKDKIKIINICYSFGMILLFLLWFGIFRMIKTGDYDLQITIDSMCLYLAGGIPAFDKLVCGELEISSNEIGGRTFRSIYALLEKFGMDFEDSLFSPYAGDGFAYIGDQITSYGLGVHTNVFTAFGSVYIDFGILGIVLFYFVYGLVIGMFERYVFIQKNGYRYIIYAYLIYPLFVLNFDEVLSLTVINYATILQWLLGYLAYHHLYLMRVDSV